MKLGMSILPSKSSNFCLRFLLAFLVLLPHVHPLLDTVIEDSPNKLFRLVTYGLTSSGTIELTLGNLILSYNDAPGSLAVVALQTNTLSELKAAAPLIEEHLDIIATNSNFNLNQSYTLPTLAKMRMRMQVFYIPKDSETWEHVFTSTKETAGWWTIYLLNSKDLVTIDFWTRTNVYQKQGHNYCNAGDMNMPYIYLFFTIIQHLVSLSWLISLFTNRHAASKMHISFFCVLLFLGLETNFYVASASHPVKSLFMSSGIDAIAWNVDKFTSDLFRACCYFAICSTVFYSVNSLEPFFPPEKFRQFATIIYSIAGANFWFGGAVLPKSQLLFSPSSISPASSSIAANIVVPLILNLILAVELLLLTTDVIATVPLNTEAFNNIGALRAVYRLWSKQVFVVQAFLTVCIPAVNAWFIATDFRYTYRTRIFFYVALVAVELVSLQVFKTSLSASASTIPSASESTAAPTANKKRAKSRRVVRSFEIA